MNKHTIEIQDCGQKELPIGHIYYYHTHGIRQGMGTCKLHSTPQCSVLIHWKPGSVMGGMGKLGKIIMRDHCPPGDLSDSVKCKRCWNKTKPL